MQRYELRGIHILIGFLVVMTVFVLTQITPSLSWTKTFNEASTGSRYHGIPCHKWPTVEEAERIMEERADIVENLGRNVSLSTGGRCPGKAELEIYFDGLRNIRRRDEAWEMIGDDEWFFGIPYSLVNS